MTSWSTQGSSEPLGSSNGTDKRLPRETGDDIARPQVLSLRRHEINVRERPRRKLRLTASICHPIPRREGNLVIQFDIIILNVTCLSSRMPSQKNYILCHQIYQPILEHSSQRWWNGPKGG